MKISLDPQARFKLERLCDFKHPREVGGRLLGMKTDDGFLIKDIFAIPNASDTPTHSYKEYSPVKYFLPLYEQMTKQNGIGNFHSHPNGSIPSEQDMKSCSGLNLWVIHHRMGEHTFAGSKDYEHLEVVLLNEPQEIRVANFRGQSFFLGDLEIDVYGRLIGEKKSLELLKLPEKTRRAYLAFLQEKKDRYNVDAKNIAERLNVTKQTARNWLKKATKLVRVTRYGVRERQ